MKKLLLIAGILVTVDHLILDGAILLRQLRRVTA